MVKNKEKGQGALIYVGSFSTFPMGKICTKAYL